MEDFDKLIYEQTVKVGDETFTIGSMLGIELESINDAFSSQASRLAYLGMLLAKAEAGHEEAKTARDMLHADLDLEVRAEFEVKKTQDPKFKPTEALVTATIKQYEDYQEVVATELKSLHNYKMMRAIVDAMRQRGEMLISLGAQLRQEYDMTGLRIKQLKDELEGRKKDG